MLGLRFLRRRGRGAKPSVGLARVADQVAAVAIAQAGDARPRVLAWEVFTAAAPGEFEQGLRLFVERYGLQGADCRVTLSPADYNLKLVERPANIPEEELADATRWLIRDLVEIDVETAAIAVLTIPDQRGRARAPHMFVAAARDEAVTSLAQLVARAGLRCGGFEVLESAMLALEASMPEAVAGGAMIRIDAKSSVLTLSSEGKLFLARPLRVDAATMEDAAERTLAASEPGGAEILALLEPLLLDVQRSLDYYESEYGRAPATRLTLLPGPIDLAPLVPALDEALRPLRVEAFSLERAFEFDSLPPTRQHAELTLACAAAVAGDKAFGPSLVPRRIRLESDSFGLRRVLYAAGALLILMGLYGGFVGFGIHRDGTALDALAQQETAIASELARLTAEAEVNGLAVAAPVDPTVLRERRDARLALLRDLGQRRPDSPASFSNLLTGLARQDLEGIWLDRIEFADAGESIELAGRTLRAEDVPTFLRRLSEEPVFAGRKFGTLEIERTPATSPGLRFHVATRRHDADVNNGGAR